jgi:hypothetical protein
VKFGGLGLYKAEDVEGGRDVRARTNNGIPEAAKKTGVGEPHNAGQLNKGG